MKRHAGVHARHAAVGDGCPEWEGREPAALPARYRAQHALGRLAVTPCFLCQHGSLCAAVQRFESHHPLRAASAAKQLDQSVAKLRRAGFHDPVQLRAGGLRSRPAILCKRRAQDAGGRRSRYHSRRGPASLHNA